MPDDRLLPIVLLILVALLCLGGFVWWRVRAAAPVDTVAQKPVEQMLRLNEPLSITLYYPWYGQLLPVPAPVTRQPDTQAQAREALVALLADQHANQAMVLKDLRLRGFFLDASGTAYVDLTPIEQREVRASAWEELLALYAIVNTLAQNFEEIKQVRFLVDGREAQTLAGHIELLRKFSKRLDLVKQ